MADVFWESISSIPFIEGCIEACEAYTGDDRRVFLFLATLRHYLALLYVKDDVIELSVPETVSEQAAHSMNLHLKLFEHAMQCGGNCPSEHCPKMKAIIKHQRGPLCSANCDCKRKKAIEVIHAKKCRNADCSVQNCGELKAKLAAKAADTIMAVGDAVAACYVVREEILDYVSMGLDISFPAY